MQMLSHIFVNYGLSTLRKSMWLFVPPHGTGRPLWLIHYIRRKNKHHHMRLLSNVDINKNNTAFKQLLILCERVFLYMMSHACASAQSISKYKCNALDFILFLILTIVDYISSSAYIHPSMYVNLKLCGATRIFWREHL